MVAMVAGMAAASLAASMMADRRAKKGQEAAAEQAAAAMARGEDAAKLFENLDAPNKQQILADIERYYGDLPPEIAEQLAQSQMEQLAADPELVGSQMESLAQLGELSEKGMTEGEMAAADAMFTKSGGRSKAEQAAIMQSMAERGMGGSGVELAARLSAAQGQAQRRNEQSRGLTEMSGRRALQALGQKASLASQMRGQGFGEGSQRASAADAIAKFNLQQRAGTQLREIERQRQEAGMKTGAGQQAFANEMAKREAQAAALTGVGKMGIQQAGMTATGAAQRSAAQQKMIGTLGAAGIKAYGNSAHGGIYKKSYEDGGVVLEGGGEVGDPNQIQVNDRETILNKRQMGNLLAREGIPVEGEEDFNEKQEMMFNELDQGNLNNVYDNGEEYADAMEDQEINIPVDEEPSIWNREVYPGERPEPDMSDSERLAEMLRTYKLLKERGEE